MATINTLAIAADAYRVGVGTLQWPVRQLVAATRGEIAAWRPVRLWMDPTDLLTLPSLVVPWLVSRRLDRNDEQPEGRRIAQGA
jgi:hypothetical protein